MAMNWPHKTMETKEFKPDAAITAGPDKIEIMDGGVPEIYFRVNGGEIREAAVDYIGDKAFFTYDDTRYYLADAVKIDRRSFNGGARKNTGPKPKNEMDRKETVNCYVPKRLVPAFRARVEQLLAELESAPRIPQEIVDAHAKYAAAESKVPQYEYEKGYKSRNAAARKLYKAFADLCAAENINPVQTAVDLSGTKLIVNKLN